MSRMVSRIKKGDPLMKLDIAYLKEHAPSIVSPVLCTELEDNQKVQFIKGGRNKIRRGVIRC